MYELWTALEQAREYKWVELSHPLDNDSPYWAGIPDGSVELSKMVYDWGNPMLDCLIQTFKFPGQFGTHIDFPGHFLKGGLLSEAYGARQLVYPLCVVDVSEKVKEDVHYAVTVQDILDYEAKYGPIPDGAFVALRTDWGKRWPSMDALSNFDAEGGRAHPRLVHGGAEIHLRDPLRRRQRPRDHRHRRLPAGRRSGRPGLRAVRALQRQAPGGAAVQPGPGGPRRGGDPSVLSQHQGGHRPARPGVGRYPVKLFHFILFPKGRRTVRGQSGVLCFSYFFKIRFSAARSRRFTVSNFPL